jgi:hypothetical protein
VVSVVAFVVSAVPAAVRWHRSPVQHYADRLNASLAAADRSGRPWSLYDTTLPPEHMPIAYEPLNRLHVFVPLVLKREPSFNDPSRTLYVVEPDGSAVRAKLIVQGSVGRSCRGTTVITVAHPLPEAARFVEFSYRAPRVTTLRVAVDDGRGWVPNSNRLTTLAGSGRMILTLRLYALTRVRLVSDDSGTCLDSVRMGEPAPAG